MPLPRSSARLGAALALWLLSGAPAQAQALRADHPLIGTWKITLPGGACHEIYRLRANGTRLVTSAEEIAESEFTLSDKPGAKGHYRWVDKIVKDNGQKDCSGAVMTVGHETTHFILLHPSRNLFLMCEREDMKACIGPFYRIDDDGT